jgi:hypothetical protein
MRLIWSVEYRGEGAVPDSEEIARAGWHICAFAEGDEKADGPRVEIHVAFAYDEEWEDVGLYVAERLGVLLASDAEIANLITPTAVTS